MKNLQGIILIIITAYVTGGSTSHLSAEEQASTTQLDARLTQTVTVADLVNYAYRENPSILSAKEAWKATVEKYRLETGYFYLWSPVKFLFQIDCLFDSLIQPHPVE